MDTIQFKDENLKSAILSEMKKQHFIAWSAKDITEDDALKVKTLMLFGKLITSIEGIENFKNLTSLYLYSNNLTDLTPLAGLSNLTILYLNSNKISDLAPLASLSNLNWLNVKCNQISNMDVLQSLPNLTHIVLNIGIRFEHD